MKNKYGLLNILTFFITLVVNYLAVKLPLNNLTTKEVADRFNVYFVPSLIFFPFGD